jgi:thiamine biosynthesis lipoprotein ApbE/Na+-translocating ferredoxin:NAD+ oxidoreductase RnfG subunit
MPWLIRTYRLAALAVAAWLIFIAQRRVDDAVTPPLVSLVEARRLFPDAARLGPRDRVRDCQIVLDASGNALGTVLKTSPQTDDLIGYAGPSDLLIGLTPEGRVQRVELLWSKDTVAHVDDVRRTTDFWRQFDGWLPASESPPKIDAVSGSTLTSLAMAEAIERRLGRDVLSLRFPQAVTLQEAQALLPSAMRMVDNDPRTGWRRLIDAHDSTIGYVIRTSPQADNVIGYQGPTEALVAIAEDRQTVTGVRLRASYDTPEYVDRVREDDGYLRQLAGRALAEWADIDFREAGIEGVSGATQTSYAVAEGMRRRIAADRRAGSVSDRSLSLRDWGLLAVVLGALVVAFTPLKGIRWVRWAWQLVLIAGFGLWFGDLLSLALVAGWSRSGLPWQTAPVLVLLTAVALLVPWLTKRQVYCHHLCPHGAAQEWLGRFRSWHIRVPARVGRGLAVVPALLLSAAFLLAVTWTTFDLALLEPFDAWVLRGAAAIPLAIAVAGLVASLFVPMAYCRFGCPTGALLKFVRSHGSNERFSSRDWLALGLLTIGAGCVFLRPTSPMSAESPRHESRSQPALAGDAFGTTWSVKLRDAPTDLGTLRDDIATELERVESRFSHWRAESETSQFNSSSTTLELEHSAEFVALVEFAQRLSRATDGAFDITIGPLVNAWGYGPSGPREGEPSADEIARRLESTGFEKLHVDSVHRSLRKQHPELQIDLGALLQGYAVDRVAAILDAAGMTEYLIDVGGELRAQGAWTVAIEDPRNPARPLRTFVLRDAALATSGVYRRSMTGQPQTRHILSPKSGRPIDAHWHLCAVVRPTCLEADGWATALLASQTQAHVIANREGIATLFATNAGEASTSDPAVDVFSPPPH